MGSKSDLPIMQQAADILAELGVTYELTIVSAHRTPHRWLRSDPTLFYVPVVAEVEVDACSWR